MTLSFLIIGRQGLVLTLKFWKIQLVPVFDPYRLTLIDHTECKYKQAFTSGLSTRFRPQGLLCFSDNFNRPSDSRNILHCRRRVAAACLAVCCEWMPNGKPARWHCSRLQKGQLTVRATVLSKENWPCNRVDLLATVGFTTRLCRWMWVNFPNVFPQSVFDGWCQQEGVLLWPIIPQTCCADHAAQGLKSSSSFLRNRQRRKKCRTDQSQKQEGMPGAPAPKCVIIDGNDWNFYLSTGLGL